MMTWKKPFDICYPLSNREAVDVADLLFILCDPFVVHGWRGM